MSRPLSLVLILAASFAATTGFVRPALAAPAAKPREYKFIAAGSDIRVSASDIPKSNKTGAHDLFLTTAHGKKPLAHLRFTNTPAKAHWLMPTEQPSDQIFLLRKAGVPDERALVVTSKGQIRDIPAGEVYAVKKLHLLVILTSDKEHDSTSLAILDLDKGKVEFEMKNASRPREFLEAGKHYRLVASENELFIAPTDAPAGASWIQVSIDGKSVDHTPPPDADSQKFLSSIPRLRWTKLKSAS